MKLTIKRPLSHKPIRSFIQGGMLSHWGRDKIADIFKSISFKENIVILIQILLSFVSSGSVDNKSALVQVMVCRQTGDKPLAEPMMTHFTNVYMCLPAARCYAYRVHWNLWGIICFVASHLIYDWGFIGVSYDGIKEWRILLAPNYSVRHNPGEQAR